MTIMSYRSCTPRNCPVLDVTFSDQAYREAFIRSGKHAMHNASFLAEIRFKHSMPLNKFP
jgi:hypothetical protein